MAKDMDDKLFEEVEYDETLFEDEPISDDEKKRVAQENFDAKQEEIFGQAEAAALGAMESVPFLKDVASLQETFGEVVTGETDLSIGAMTEAYRRNKREWDDSINDAEEKYPFTTGAAGFGTSVGLGMLTGGASTVGRAALWGAAEGLSRSEERGFEDVVGGAVLGAGGYGVGKGIGKAMQFVGEKLGLLASKGGAEAVGAVNKTNVKIMDSHVKNTYIKNGSAKNIREAYKQFTKDLMEETDINGNKFLGVTQTIRETSEKAAEKKDFYGKKIGEVLRSVDDKISKVDSEGLHKSLLDDLVAPLKEVNDPNAQRLAVKLERRLQSQFMVKDGVKKVEEIVWSPDNVATKVSKEVDNMVYKDMNLKSVHDIKNYVAKEVRNSFDKEGRALSSEAIEMKRYVGKVGKYIDDVIEESGVEIPEASTYKALKRKWSNMNTIEEVSTDAAASYSNGPMSVLKTTLSLKGPILLAASGAGAAMHPALGPVVAMGINQSLASSRTPVALAQGLGRVSEFLTRNPNHKYAKAIMTASSISTDYLHKTVSGIAAEINLMASPVKRNSEDVQAKRSSILAAIERQDPQLANQLQEALDEGQPIGAIMDQISKQVEGKFIEDGVGWDGMVYDPADKAQLEEEIRRSELPVAEEIRLLEELKQNKIPQIQPMEPFTRSWSPRDRSKHRY
jgi:hypothetical protein